jgi:hypothetical protein
MANQTEGVWTPTLIIQLIIGITQAMLVLIGLIFGVYRFLVMRNGDIIGI